MTSNNTIETGLCLRVLEGAHQVVYHPLTRETISIGRAVPDAPYSDSYLTFPEPTLSRLHAVLTWEANARSFLVHHRSQTNPTLLNGLNLTGPQVLKPGDTLTLGRLVVMVEKSKVEVPQEVEAPTQAEVTLSLIVEREKNSAHLPLKSDRLQLVFSSSITTVGGPDPNGQCNIPAAIENTLDLSVDLEAQTALVKTENESIEVLRKTELSVGTLCVPLTPQNPLKLTLRDSLVHQGYQISLSLDDPGSAVDANRDDPTIGIKTLQAPDQRPYLKFTNGVWAGATLMITKKGSSVFDLGDGATTFALPVTFATAPLVRVTVKNEKARLRVLKMGNDQTIEVDGRLLYTGESAPLESGSQIRLAGHSFSWIVPRLHSLYRQLRIVGSEGAYAINKASVRLGTAPHCELRLDSPRLAPVTGTLRFDDQGFYYEHHNITMPARVDGVETSSGLRTPVKVGSQLELVPELTFTLKESGDR